MQKTQRKPSKPKLKLKQKQRQHQTVVVNVIQPKRRIATRTSRRGGTTGAGGGGAGGGNYVAYRSPIINDPYIPQQFQQIPTINFPQQALENKPTTTPLIEYPTPTTLQTVSADVRPLVALRENTGSVMTEMTPLSIDTTKPKPKRLIPPPLSPTRSIGSGDLGEFNLGSGDFTFTNPLHPAQFSPPRSGLISPMENPLLQEVIRKAPTARRANLSGYTAEQKAERRRIQGEQTRQANLIIGMEKKDRAKFLRELDVEGFLEGNPIPVAEVKKRGRPKGSKNKPK